MFDRFFRKLYNRTKKKVEKKGTKQKLNYYKKNIYILTMSITSTTIIVVISMIYSRNNNHIEIPPTLYTTLFILIAIFFGHIAELIEVIKNSANN
tara:strand:- start:190 stop:474 length:285 start_codon:yes stop_codon:yes gene_type:complete